MNDRNVKWVEKKLIIPPDAVNFALSKNGAKAYASSCGGGFSAEGVINGKKTLLGWGQDNGWKAPPVTWHPNWWGEWVRVDFPKTVEIDTIIVYNFPKMVIDRPWYNLLHYQVQYLNEKQEWITVSTIRHNKDDINVVSFDKVKAVSIRIWVNRNHFREESGFEQGWFEVDESPRFLEVEAYSLNGEQPFKITEGCKEIVSGKKGAAAIFYDETFCPKACIDVAKISRWLEDWGYGINLLTADDLCRPEIFCAGNFSVLVHPYGKYFPITTNLYDFLMGGGNLMTFGGRAFTAAKQKHGGKWIDIDMDPQLTVSGSRYIDYFRAYRDQLGMFTVPGSKLERVNKVSTRTDQLVSTQNVEFCGQVEGWMALSMVGELQPLDETRRYANEGRMPEINHTSREGVNRNKADVPILWGDALDENYASVFGYACSRWVPLLDSFDEAGRNRGPVLSLMPHYEGMYDGSSWLFCGVENADVLEWPNMEGLLRDSLEYMQTGIIAHSLEPSYSCYYTGESPEFSLIIDSSSKTAADIELEIEICGLSEVLYTVKDSLKLEAKSWKRLDYKCPQTVFKDDFYKIAATISVNGKVIDRLENGFIVWAEAVLKEGPNVSFKDNFFHFDNKARYVTGARDSGLHMPWQPETNVLGWDTRYRMYRDYGMQVASPVHMDWCFPGLGWGDFDPKQPIPEIILRQMDAQVQLAQKHKIIYAPCIFFVYEKIAMQKPDISRRICEVLGERYKDVPGIMFFIFDDGLRHDPDIFNAWAKECVDGFNSYGREYLVTAEIGFRQVWPDAMRRSAKHLSFSNGSNFRTSVGDPVYERIIDLRPAGKSFTLGEFVRRIPTGTAEDFHGYLAPVHLNFGMGYAMSLNWKWSTPYHSTWPSDTVFPGNNVPKKHLYAYRNEALFYRIFEPVYKSPPFMIVMPSNYWLKNSEALTNYMVGLLRNLMEMKLDFACIDEEDLDLLPMSTTKGLLLPMPLEYTQKAYALLKNFVNSGGKAFIIGDLGQLGVGIEGEGSAEWLNELCGIVRKGAVQNNKGRSIYMDRFMPRGKVNVNGSVYETLLWIDLEAGRAQVKFSDENGRPIITRAEFGKGSAWFMNNFDTKFPCEFLQGFLDEAGIKRMKVTPDNPALHCFEASTADGPVFTMFTFPWDQSLQNVTLSLDTGEITMLLKDQSMGVVALTQDKQEVYALESQGDVCFNGKNLIASDTHIMLAALDKKDVSKSDALLLLPLVGTGNVKINTSSDTVEQGEFVDGRWVTYEVVSHNNSSGTIDITITDDNISKIFMVMPKSVRDKAIKLLESTMLN